MKREEAAALNCTGLIDYGVRAELPQTNPVFDSERSRLGFRVCVHACVPVRSNLWFIPVTADGVHSLSDDAAVFSNITAVCSETVSVASVYFRVT